MTTQTPRRRAVPPTPGSASVTNVAPPRVTTPRAPITPRPQNGPGARSERPARPGAPTSRTARPGAGPRPDAGFGRHRRVGPARQPGRRNLVRLGAVGAVLLLVLALVLWSFLHGRADTIHGIQRYPGTPPAEWGPGVSWASPALASGVAPAVVGGGEAVALVTEDHTLLLVGAKDGAVRWRAPLPRDAEIHGPPTATHVGGADVVALHVGDRLTWWNLADGSHDGMDVPAGAVVSLLGEIPFVNSGDQVTPVTGDHPTPVTVPKGSTALAAHKDGQLTIAGPNGWAHLGPDGSTRSSGPWENASSPAPTVAGYAGGFVLLVRPGSGRGPATLEAHADTTNDVRYVFGGPVLLPPGGRVTWTASPSGTWGILGRSLVDLRSGRVEDLGVWSTSSVTADRAYGHIDGQTVVVGPALARGVLAPGEAIPEALTSAGALVRGPAPGTATSGAVDPRRADDTVYLLPPRRTAS